MLAIVASNSIQLYIPWLTKEVVDQLSDGLATESALMGTAWLILLLGSLAFVAKQIWRHLLLGAARRIEAELRRKLLQQTMRMTPAAADATNPGKFMALASNDIPAIGQALAFGLIAFFDSVFITSIAVILMFQISAELTLLAVLPIPVLIGLMMASLQLIYRRFDKVQASLEKLTEKTRESLSGLRTLTAYNQADGDAHHFRRFNDIYLIRMLEYVRIDAVFPPLILLFAGSSTALLLFFGGPLVLEGKLSLGGFAAFFGYLGLLTWPMIAAGWMLVLLQRGAASMGRLDEILSADTEPDSDPNESRLGERTSHRLEVRNLNFGYLDAPLALKNWSFVASPGTTVGLVGPVGSGKSTFFKLLSRLVEVPPDSIFLDGVDISTLPPGQIRQSIGCVPQEPFLFSESIAENLKLASAKASPAELNKVIDQACLRADLAKFPDGLETMLGERGVTLSGGQRQRTALARALLKGAPILLLDDTLSAVDTVTERKLLESLHKASRNEKQLTLIVSHRLSAVESCDQILVCRAGEIVERGTHAHLLEQGGLYSELHRHQQHRPKHD